VSKTLGQSEPTGRSYEVNRASAVRKRGRETLVSLAIVWFWTCEAVREGNMQAADERAAEREVGPAGEIGSELCS